MIVPRTTASAWRSPAERRPSRPSTASRTVAFTFEVRVGSEVKFSKGRTATVLISGGRPPPANPYTHPASRVTLRAARTPDVRRETGSGIAQREGQVEPRGAVRDQQG